MRLAIFNKHKMFAQNNSKTDENFKIFVIRNKIESGTNIDDFVEKIFLTGVRDYVFVPLIEARRYCSTRENCYVATDNEEISQKYGIKLLKNQYQ